MSVIIRLQNLPWSANASDVRTFFKGLLIPDGGVHIVGGEDGDAFIAFGSDEDARLAMRKTGEILKGIQITLYLSSRSEMQKVIEEARQQAMAQQYVAKPTPQVQPSAPPASVQPQAPPPPIINNVASNIVPGASSNLPSAPAPFLAPPYFQQNDKFSTEGGSIGSGGYDWYKQQRAQAQTAPPPQSNDPRVNADPRRQPQPVVPQTQPPVQRTQPADYPNQYNYQQPPAKTPFGQPPYMMSQQPPRQHETSAELKPAVSPASKQVKPEEKKDVSNRHSSTVDKKDSKSSSSADRRDRDRERDRSTRRRRSRSRSRDHDRRSSRHHRSRSRDRSSRRTSRRSRSRSKERVRDGGRSDRSRTRGSSRDKNDRRPQDGFMTPPPARHQAPQSTSAETLSMFSQQNVRNSGDTLPGLGEIPNDMPKILTNILGTPAHQREMITSDMHDSIKDSDGARQGEIWPGAMRNEKKLPDRWGNDGVKVLPPPINKPFIPDGPGDQRMRVTDGPNGRPDKPNWQNQQREHSEMPDRYGLRGDEERPSFGKGPFEGQEEKRFEDQRENPVGQFDPRVGRGSRFDGLSARGMPGPRFEGPNGRGAPPFGRGEGHFEGPVGGRGMMFENRGMRFEGPGRGGRFERPFGRGEPPFDATNGGPETFTDKPPFNGPPIPNRFDGGRGRGGRFGGPPFEDWGENHNKGFNPDGGFPARGRGGRGGGVRRFDGEFEDGGMSGPPPAEIFRGGRGGMFRGRGRGGFPNSGGGSPADNNSPRHSTETCSIEILNIPLISRYRDLRSLFEGMYIPPDAIKVLGDEKGTRIGVALLRFSNPKDAFESTKFSGKYIYDNQVQIRLIDEEVYDKHPDVWVTREKNKAERFDSYHEEPIAEGLPPMQLVPSDWVHVMGLNPNRSEEDVYKIFEQYNVKDVVREFERVSKAPTGGFFSRFSCPEEAADVCCNVNSRRYEGDILHLVHVMPNIVRNNAPIELQRKDHATLSSSINNVGQKRPIDEVEPHPEQSAPKVKKELLTDSVMLTNLSFDVSERDIHDFFSHTGLLPEKIHLLPLRDSRSKKAYVVFTEIQNAKDALQRNGQMLRQLPLTIELVAKPEVMTALGLSFSPLELIKKTNSFNQMKPQVEPMVVAPSNGDPSAAPQATQSEVIVEQFGRPGCVVALSNVHFDATTDDIIAFLSAEFPSVIPENVIRRYDERGMATSDARVALPSPDAARRAITILNNKVILGNPVQVTLV